MKLNPAEWRAAIPSDLKPLRRWVGRAGKTPLHPLRETAAKSGRPETWGTFEEVAAFYERYATRPDRGAGFEFAAEDGLVGIDLDLALDPAGVPYPWAAELIQPFIDLGGAYVERSPSGRGLHLITRAQLPRNPNRIDFGGIVEEHDGKEKHSGVEVYRDKRYFTVTGDVVYGLGTIGDGQSLVEALLDATGLTARMNREAEAPPEQAGQEPHREAEIRSALSVLDPDMDYPDWLNVGMALHASLGSTGFRLWNEWSALGSKYEGPDDLLIHWRSFRAGKGVALGTLIHMAQEAGWVRPPVDAAETFKDFDDDSDLLGGPGDDAGDGFPSAPTVPYQMTRKNLIASTAGNLVLYFSQDPKWKGRLRWNIRRGAELDGRAMQDNDYTQLGTAAERALCLDGGAAKDHLYRAVEAVARMSEYDPVLDFILSAPWDGVPRIDEWLVRAGARDTRLNRLIARRFLIGAAGRALGQPQPGYPPLGDEGTKMDYVVILEGPQGLKKSWLCNTLCPPGYFFESHFSLNGAGTKDFYQALGSHFLVEMAELDAMNKSETTSIDAMITNRTDTYRPPYGRVTIRAPRRAVIMGTTNEREWNRNLNGMRRFWPVALWGVTKLELDWIRDNLQQLYAEALVRYKAGEVYWDDDEMKALLAPEYETRTSLPGWAADVEAFLFSPEVQAHGYVTPHVLTSAVRILLAVPARELGKYLRTLGCVDRLVKTGGRPQRIWALPGRPNDHAGLKALVESNPYADAIDAEVKVLPA